MTKLETQNIVNGIEFIHLMSDKALSEAWGVLVDLARRCKNPITRVKMMEGVRVLLNPKSAIRRGLFQLVKTEDVYIDITPSGSGTTSGSEQGVALPVYIFSLCGSESPTLHKIFYAIDPDDEDGRAAYRTMDRVRMRAYMDHLQRITTPAGGTVYLFFLEGGPYEFVYSAEKGWDEFPIRPEDVTKRTVPVDMTYVVLPRDIR